MDNTADLLHLNAKFTVTMRGGGHGWQLQTGEVGEQSLGEQIVAAVH